MAGRFRTSQEATAATATLVFRRIFPPIKADIVVSGDPEKRHVPVFERVCQRRFRLLFHHNST